MEDRDKRVGEEIVGELSRREICHHRTLTPEHLQDLDQISAEEDLQLQMQLDSLPALSLIPRPEVLSLPLSLVVPTPPARNHSSSTLGQHLPSLREDYSLPATASQELLTTLILESKSSRLHLSLLLPVPSYRPIERH